MKYRLQQYYKVIGISKQGFHQWKQREYEYTDLSDKVMHIVKQIRQDQPGMGLRTIWEEMDIGLSRQKFEMLAKQLGLQIQPKQNLRKTTNSRGVKWCDNLIENLLIKRINQVWVSDITYYRIIDRFYYITLIMDLYSRRIIGHQTSRTLYTQDTTLSALKMALSVRSERQKSEGLIFHSDGGGQYYAREFVKILNKEGIKRSMAKKCLENSNAERLNGTIKNYYLKHWKPTNYNELRRYTAKACINYNDRPHKSLGKMSPLKYEQQMENLEKSKVFHRSTYSNNYNILN